ncbi:MAG: hypothetical protein JSR60_02265 [Proteobacteria bacterium]|nr:hypothetical protein [Pseudomonadota bacterium]
MQYVCDAPGRKTWFRIETDGEATLESEAMQHGVDNHFRDSRTQAAASYRPARNLHPIERDIGLKAHIAHRMPIFLTLREHDGTALATAILPPDAKPDPDFAPMIVGPQYSDPKSSQADAIAALEKHFGLNLETAGHNPFLNFAF